MGEGGWWWWGEVCSGFLLPAKGTSQGFVDGLVIFSSLLKESISRVRSVVKSKEFMVFVNFLLPSETRISIPEYESHEHSHYIRSTDLRKESMLECVICNSFPC